MLIRFHPLMAMITKLRSDSSDQIADRLLYRAAGGGTGELTELLEQLR
jgi:hypothetical protein